MLIIECTPMGVSMDTVILKVFEGYDENSRHHVPVISLPGLLVSISTAAPVPSRENSATFNSGMDPCRTYVVREG